MKILTTLGKFYVNEFEGADWIDEIPQEGARFKGRNKNEKIGEWEVTCYVTSYEQV